MAREALVAAALLGGMLLPPACEKFLGKTPAPPQTDPVPILPSATATAPPTYQPPDPVGMPPPTSAPPPGQSPEYVKAKDAMEKRDYKKAKVALEKKVKGGKSTQEEAQLLYDACLGLKDKACADMVHKAHPEIGPP